MRLREPVVSSRPARCASLLLARELATATFRRGTPGRGRQASARSAPSSTPAIARTAPRRRLGLPSAGGALVGDPVGVPSRSRTRDPHVLPPVPSRGLSSGIRPTPALARAASGSGGCSSRGRYRLPRPPGVRENGSVPDSAPRNLSDQPVAADRRDGLTTGRDAARASSFACQRRGASPCGSAPRCSSASFASTTGSSSAARRPRRWDSHQGHRTSMAVSARGRSLADGRSTSSGCVGDHV